MDNARKLYLQMLFEICAEEQIKIQSFSDDWFFYLTRNNRRQVIYDHQFALNNAPARDLCNDKCALSEFLAYGGVSQAEHFLFSEENRDAVGPLLTQYQKLVIKKNNGSGGRDVFRVSTPDELEPVLTHLLASCRYIAVSPYYSIDAEYRAVILQGRVELVYEKLRPYVTGDGVTDVNTLIQEKYQGTINPLPCNFIPAAGEAVCVEWRHNLQRGAVPKLLNGDEAVYPAIIEIARQAADLTGLGFASVDIITSGERMMVLEINPGIMMENFAGQNAACYETAKSIYKKAIVSAL